MCGNWTAASHLNTTTGVYEMNSHVSLSGVRNRWGQNWQSHLRGVVFFIERAHNQFHAEWLSNEKPRAHSTRAEFSLSMAKLIFYISSFNLCRWSHAAELLSVCFYWISGKHAFIGARMRATKSWIAAQLAGWQVLRDWMGKRLISLNFCTLCEKWGLKSAFETESNKKRVSSDENP